MIAVRLWLSAMTALGLIVLAGPMAQAAATTIADLQAAGRLEISARLSPDEDIVPGQKLTLNLKIATDRWFSGGTRIVLPEVPGLVILQTEQFASNASERRGEQNWVIQRWTLDIYPQRAGDFTIPTIASQVQVNAAAGDDVSGTLASPPVSFSVAVPPALADVQQWVAAPDFAVSQQFDRSLDGLQVGDAFERTIVFQASDVMAMMLPSAPPGEFNGLASYPSPPVLENTNNRGQASASRTERVSYVVEAEGRYQLPALDFYWWDTTAGELQLISLPPQEIVVGTGIATTASTDSALQAVSKRQLLLGAGSLILLLGLLWLGWRYLPRLPLARLTGTLHRLREQVRELRKPALPRHLNPGGNAGE